jgi:hypothetical protein
VGQSSVPVGGGQRPRATREVSRLPSSGDLLHSTRLIRTTWFSFSPYSGTIPPIKSAQGEGDDVKKLFTIGCPVILATLGVALLFIVRKKRKEKRLKRLRGGGSFLERLLTPGHTGRTSVDHPGNRILVSPQRESCYSNLLQHSWLFTVFSMPLGLCTAPTRANIHIGAHW